MMWLEKKFRRVIREELLNVLEHKPNVLSVKSDIGAEIIMPNLIKERFDAGQITSIGDIV